MHKRIMILVSLSFFLPGCNSPSLYGVEESIIFMPANPQVSTSQQFQRPTAYSTPTQAELSAAFSPVPLDKLANYRSIKKKQTSAEFQQAYNIALDIVAPLAGLSREQQLIGIAHALRSRFDARGGKYSTSDNHYNDPYGYLVLGVSSCAGSTRTTGLCLNILGIPYEHVNENKWAHQWCRVNINGTYWICDPFGLYVGPEPAPYSHPRA